MQSIFAKTIEAIIGSSTLNGFSLDLTLIKIDLIERMESMIKSILINQADYYPQAPITGGTLKMNNVINEVNRVDDE